MKRRALLAGALAAACSQAVPRPSSTARPDVIAGMSVEDKAGQLMTVAFHGRQITPHLERMIRDKRIGGVNLFKENFDDAASLRRLIDDLSRIAADARVPPLFFGIDQEGGAVVRVAKGAAVMPGQMALAATPDPQDSVRRAAAITARELRSIGVNLQFAPVADVNTEPSNPIIGNRSYGADPQRVAELVGVAVRAYADAGLLCCAKHFPGHGATTTDSHSGLPELTFDRARLERVELVPFKAAIAADVPAIMSAHIRVGSLDPTPDRPATLSPKVMEDLLRRDLRFAGLSLTDDLEMGALQRSGGEAKAALAAVQAGADHVLLRFDESAQLVAHRLLVDAARGGTLPAARLETALRRIVAAKERAGAFDTGERPAYDAAADRVEALDLARGAVTVLRAGGALPLRGKVLAVGPTYADISRIDDQARPLHEVLAAAYPGATALATNTATKAEILDAARAADLIVLATADAYIDQAQADLGRTLAALRPTVVVAQRGPYDIAAIPGAAAYLCTYDGREASNRACAEILMGARAPRGRLPVNIPGSYGIGAGLTDLR